MTSNGTRLYYSGLLSLSTGVIYIVIVQYCYCAGEYSFSTLTQATDFSHAAMHAAHPSTRTLVSGGDEQQHTVSKINT